MTLVLSVSSRALLSACDRLGLDTDQILAAAGVDRAVVNEPDSRIPVRGRPGRHRTTGGVLVALGVVGLGAGTQVLTRLPYFVMVGKPDELSRAVLMGAGWVINVVVAEWTIPRGRRFSVLVAG